MSNTFKIYNINKKNRKYKNIAFSPQPTKSFRCDQPENMNKKNHEKVMDK